MSGRARIVTVDESNVEELGFFCYKSKPKSPGYQHKLRWLKERMAEGLRIKILFEGERSVGFIEYIPGEHTWRVVEAPSHMVIHCLWVVGRAKEKGYGSRLIGECIAEAREQDKHGVVMISSRGNWLANERIFLQNGFERIDTAPPGFSLLLRRLEDGVTPAFPHDWEARLASFGSGATVVYTDQCPYMPDAVQHALDTFEKRGIEAKVVKLETSAEARAKSPTPYGVFALVVDGKLLTYHYIGRKELRKLDGEILASS